MVAWGLALSVVAGCSKEFGVQGLPVDTGTRRLDTADTDTAVLAPDEPEPVDTEAPVLLDDTADTDPPVDSDTDVPVDTAVVVVDTVVLAPIDTVDTDLPIDTDTGPTPAAPLVPYYELAGDLLWPESGAYDGQTSAFFVGSLSEGHITRLGTDGSRVIWYDHPGSVTGWQTWGIEIDEARRRLFACSRQGDFWGAPWHVWVFDLDTEQLIADLDMDTSLNNAQCRDFAIGPATGLAYVTDRGQDVAHVVDAAAGTVSVWSDDPVFGVGQWGPDGIAVSSQAGVVLVAKSKPPALMRIPLSDPTQVTEVSLGGTGGMLGGGHGLDAMEWYQGDLWVAGVNRLIQVTPDDPSDWTTGTNTSWSAPSGGVSGLALADGSLYTINGDPFAWTLNIAPDLPFEVSEVLFPLQP